jgi:hypothetical protein
MASELGISHEFGRFSVVSGKHGSCHPHSAVGECVRRPYIELAVGSKWESDGIE